ASLAAGLNADAGRIWRRMLAEPDGAALPVDAVAADAGLGGDDARSAMRLRAALDDLEDALLVWHTYRADGSRWLFVPDEIRSPRPAPAPALPPLAPLSVDVTPDPWRHPDALAWDLLTTARSLSLPGAPLWPPAGEPPHAVLRELAGRLWLAPDEPPAAYVGFLLALGRAAGMLAPRDDPQPPRLDLAPSFRAWRDRPFAALSAELRGLWESSATWIEGVGDGRIEVRGVDWAGARRRLLRALADPASGIAPGAWHALDAVAARIAALQPDLLGATFVAATASMAGEAGAGASEDEARQAAIADVVAVELAGALRWFGIVETGVVPGAGAAARLPPAAPDDGDDGDAAGGAPLAIAAEGEIELRAPSPVRVWSLLTFSDPVALGPVCRFRLSAASLARALAAGFDPDQVVHFLRRQSGGALPPGLEERIAAWARGYRRIRLRRALLVAPDDAETRAAAAALLAAHGMTIRDLGDAGLLVESPAADTLDRAVETLLRADGFAPQWTDGGRG
ncbi:MAG TPA: helicase-associated domain-containing protein, partial [Thermomicrobiales bacterium]|nr:helicase-associated domain-containing protein [Thermomicrobiales bacterium]